MSDYAKMFQQMMEQTAEMGKKFAPEGNMFSPAAFEAMMPGVSASFLEMAFGNTINQNGLDAKTRFLITIAGLSAQILLQAPQLKLAIESARVAGAKKQEITEVIMQMSMFGGMPVTTQALQAALEVFNAEENGKD
ncbi:MAG: carboxymuconolactone decarboxylase family protein [Rhodobacter sp.]|jgi:4-carboxymuconolactone decarboxylase|nr:carboxymuconolactone decarboxylase family protein [Rhodobacter sp.]